VGALNMNKNLIIYMPIKGKHIGLEKEGNHKGLPLRGERMTFSKQILDFFLPKDNVDRNVNFNNEKRI